MAERSFRTTGFFQGTPLQLLAIQGFLVGYSLALLYAIAYARFLLDYGSDAFPQMYVISAIAAPIVTFFYNRLSSRTTKKQLLMTVSVVIFITYFIIWIAGTWSTLRWISFVIMVYFNIVFIFQLILISVQSTLLFDLRQMKSVYPLVLASQSGALIVSGLSVTLLTGVLGGVSNLLFVCVLFSAVQTAVMWATIQRYPSAFQSHHHIDSDQQQAGRGQLA